jgi:hypothetical protein
LTSTVCSTSAARRSRHDRFGLEGMDEVLLNQKSEDL